MSSIDTSQERLTSEQPLTPEQAGEASARFTELLGKYGTRSPIAMYDNLDIYNSTILGPPIKQVSQASFRSGDTRIDITRSRHDDPHGDFEEPRTNVDLEATTSMTVSRLEIQGEGKLKRWTIVDQFKFVPSRGLALRRDVNIGTNKPGIYQGVEYKEMDKPTLDKFMADSEEVITKSFKLSEKLRSHVRFNLGQTAVPHSEGFAAPMYTSPARVVSHYRNSRRQI